MSASEPSLLPLIQINAVENIKPEISPWPVRPLVRRDMLQGPLYSFELLEPLQTPWIHL